MGADVLLKSISHRRPERGSRREPRVSCEPANGAATEKKMGVGGLRESRCQGCVLCISVLCHAPVQLMPSGSAEPHVLSIGRAKTSSCQPRRGPRGVRAYGSGHLCDALCESEASLTHAHQRPRRITIMLAGSTCRAAVSKDARIAILAQILRAEPTQTWT